MKKLVLFSAVLFLGLGSFTNAQELSKEEKKEWKKKLKGLTPGAYKKLLDDKEKLSVEKADLERSNADLDGRVRSLETENTQLHSEIDDYKATIQAQKNAVETASQGDAGSSNGGNGYDNYSRNSTKGISFRVQVGAFKELDLKKYYDKHPNFGVETDPDGTMRYTIGIFQEYWEADRFKKYLRDMGVKGAWVVSYKDGKRVNIKDALEGVL